MNIPTENRKKPRIGFKRPVLLEKIFIESNQFNNFQQGGVSLNISESGLGLTSNSALAKGEVVKLLIPVSKNGVRIPVFGEVIWSHFARKSFKTGLRFL